MNSATNSSVKRMRLALVAMVVAVAALASFAGPAAAHSDDPCELELTPKAADNPLGAVHTVTAYVTRKGQLCKNGADGGPLVGATVNFKIVSGPNAGLTGTAVTDANGVATWQWVSNTPGTDVVQAWIDTQICNEAGYTVANCPAGKLGIDTVGQEAIKNWIPPNPPVTPTVDPNVEIRVSKKCVTRTFVVRANNTGSFKVTKSVLYIDGKKVRTNRTGTFKINTGRYSSRSHRFKTVTTFSNGTVITKNGTFKLCKSRLTSRKLDPRFTG